MITYNEFKKRLEDNKVEFLDSIIIISCETLEEGKWIPGRFDNNIRIDNPTYGAGQKHAHVYGRKGNEIGIVNFDGTASHGTRCKLSQRDADSLRARGFSIRDDFIVEWIKTDQSTLLLEDSSIIWFPLSLK